LQTRSAAGDGGALRARPARESTAPQVGAALCFFDFWGFVFFCLFEQNATIMLVAGKHHICFSRQVQKHKIRPTTTTERETEY
jgi:hypothetical protein